ncbi:uncharacterized protein LOC125453799 [Stegostoma tigrinum]|uniref:uncharacterized protein LOC125453799 n=1 Tax=Stegostoma tigrinum TaxID=3053191 RepID=UPI00287071B1|nr:uncharacterized protein LOC125453799 [Stegostoma tigrinum]
MNEIRQQAERRKNWRVDFVSAGKMKIILFLFAAARILYQSDSIDPCEPSTFTEIDIVLNATVTRLNRDFAMGNPLTIVNCRVTNITNFGERLFQLDLAFDAQEATSSSIFEIDLALKPLSSTINLACTSQVRIDFATILSILVACDITSTTSTPEPSTTPTPLPSTTPSPETSTTPASETSTTPTPEPMTTPTPETSTTLTPEPMTTPTPETSTTLTPEPMTTPTPETSTTPTPEPMTTPTPETSTTLTPEPMTTPTPETSTTLTPEPLTTPTPETSTTPTSEPMTTPTPETSTTLTPEPMTTPTPETSTTPTPEPMTTPTPETSTTLTPENRSYWVECCLAPLIKGCVPAALAEGQLLVGALCKAVSAEPEYRLGQTHLSTFSWLSSVQPPQVISESQGASKQDLLLVVGRR